MVNAASPTYLFVMMNKIPKKCGGGDNSAPLLNSRHSPPPGQKRYGLRPPIECIVLPHPLALHPNPNHCTCDAEGEPPRKRDPQEPGHRVVFYPPRWEKPHIKKNHLGKVLRSRTFFAAPLNCWGNSPRRLTQMSVASASVQF